MAQLQCGSCGQAAVVRFDPKSDGMLAMCDVCGWRAPKVVGRESREFEENGPAADNLRVAQAQERKQLADGQARRRAD